eukprot:3941896-Rhodomonas_salina.5
MSERPALTDGRGQLSGTFRPDAVAAQIEVKEPREHQQNSCEPAHALGPDPAVSEVEMSERGAGSQGGGERACARTPQRVQA